MFTPRKSSRTVKQIFQPCIPNVPLSNCLTLRYDSLRFGLENSPSPATPQILSDTGELLGGKRAAIQFYHDRRRKNDLTKK